MVTLYCPLRQVPKHQQTQKALDCVDVNTYFKCSDLRPEQRPYHGGGFECSNDSRSHAVGRRGWGGGVWVLVLCGSDNRTAGPRDVRRRREEMRLRPNKRYVDRKDHEVYYPPPPKKKIFLPDGEKWRFIAMLGVLLCQWQTCEMAIPKISREKKNQYLYFCSKAT